MFKIVKKTNLVLMVLLVFVILITGCGGSKKKENSGSEITAPTPPTNVSIVEADSKLSVSWDVVSGASFYQVYVAQKNDSSFAELSSVSTDKNCVLSGLTNDNTYYIWVKSKNTAGISDFSEVVQGTPKKSLGIPYPPNSFNLKSSSESITVNWEAVADATSYEVWYGTSSNSSEAKKFKDIVDALTCEITGLSENIEYYVWLKAKNNVGTSDFSYFQNVTTQADGSIIGLVNSDSSYTVILVETKNTLYFSNSAYFSFTGLPAGKYHIKFEKSGFESIIKEITLTKNEIKDIGTYSFNKKLSDGSGGLKNYEHYHIVTGASDDIDYKSFTLTYPETVLVEYNTLRFFNNELGRIYKGSTLIWENKEMDGSCYLNLSAGSYKTRILNLNKTPRMRITWSRDLKAPKIDISKTWCNSNEPEQTSINCYDGDLGIKTVQYAITNSLSTPTSFTTIPKITAVQFLNKGIWYLHVKATDKEESPANTSYRVEGPYIIN